MGDQTTVTLKVPNQYKDIIKELDGSFDEEFSGANNTHLFIYADVNYGELDILYSLKSRGIPYDNSWEAGWQYGPGTTSCRFSPEGEVIVKTIYDSELNPEINVLLSLIETPDKLVEYILKHQEKNSVLPWDNQAEYGKLYLARKLIEPNP